MSYTMIDNGKAIRCDDCGTASYNAGDILHKFCSRCQKYHHDRPAVGSRVWITRNELESRYPEDTINTDYSRSLNSQPAAEVCRAEPDARPSSSDPVDFGSSSNDCRPSSDSGGGWGGD